MRIFLVGFMGSGKSHWGKIWASVYNKYFYDLDEMIENKAEKKIADIFQTEGEAYFRKIESIELRSTVSYDDCIIACGGGTACFENNMDWMNEHGITVYLSASPGELLKNILKDAHTRPLIKNMSMAEVFLFIEQMLDKRRPFYERATYQVEFKNVHEGSLTELIKTGY